MLGTAKLVNATPRSGENRSIAFNNPSDATCRRSSAGSPRRTYRNASWRARGRCARRSSSRSCGSLVARRRTNRSSRRARIRVTGGQVSLFVTSQMTNRRRAGLHALVRRLDYDHAFDEQVVRDPYLLVLVPQHRGRTVDPDDTATQVTQADRLADREVGPGIARRG